MLSKIRYAHVLHRQILAALAPDASWDGVRRRNQADEIMERVQQSPELDHLGAADLRALAEQWEIPLVTCACGRPAALQLTVERHTRPLCAPCAREAELELTLAQLRANTWVTAYQLPALANCAA